MVSDKGVQPVLIAPPQLDAVDVSAFAPERMAPGEGVLVQIYLHQVGSEDVARALALAADPQTRGRGQATLDLDIPRGSRVAVLIEADGLDVDQPAQSIVWQGRPRACPFIVSAKADAVARMHNISARLLLNGVPAGRLVFRLEVAQDAAAGTGKARLRGDGANRYARAFLSYCRDDLTEVLKRAEALRAARIGFFQDILSLEPGEEWMPRLFEEIDHCDLFLLFRSKKAAASTWVLREAEHALSRRRQSIESVPDITPIILDGPPAPEPPASLQSLHFDDWMRYMIVAGEHMAGRSPESGAKP